MLVNINLGGIDKNLRLVVGISVIIWGVLMGNIWGVVGVVFIITGLLKRCPLYSLLGVKTCKVEERK